MFVLASFPILRKANRLKRSSCCVYLHERYAIKSRLIIVFSKFVHLVVPKRPAHRF
jgi:hypothetical protein